MSSWDDVTDGDMSEALVQAQEELAQSRIEARKYWGWWSKADREARDWKFRAADRIAQVRKLQTTVKELREALTEAVAFMEESIKPPRTIGWLPKRQRSWLQRSRELTRVEEANDLVTGQDASEPYREAIKRYVDMRDSYDNFIKRGVRENKEPFDMKWYAEWQERNKDLHAAENDLRRIARGEE